jgi:hypothetical protein
MKPKCILWGDYALQDVLNVQEKKKDARKEEDDDANETPIPPRPDSSCKSLFIQS